MNLFITVVLLAFLSIVIGELVQMEQSIKFSASLTNSNWVKQNHQVTDKDTVKCIFVLKHDKSSVSSYESDLLSVSTPGSKVYGKWFNKEDIKKRLAPSSVAVEKVMSYIASHGVTGKLSTLGDMIFVEMPATVAETMLSTKFAKFGSLRDRRVSLLRVTQEYFLPSEIAEHVNLVDDIVRLPALRKHEIIESMAATDATSGDAEYQSCGLQCNGDTTPAVLQAAYNFGTLKTAAAGNSVAVAEFQYQFFDTPDLESFASACDVDVKVSTVIGKNVEALCESTGCVEALLDIEYIGAIVNPIPLTVVYQGDFSLLTWAETIIALDAPPLINSVSYGNDEVQQTSVEYMQSVNEQFMIATSMGLSILFASGDQGVWGRSGVGKTFNPDFPAGSPYVTAVGGTNMQTQSQIGAESAWDCGGGGFSDTFSQPSFQSAQVANYLSVASSVLPASSFFNASGRAYPDISALAGQVNPYCVSIRGGTKFGGVAGTSAACPVVSGIFSLLNNDRLAAGKTALGWLNPLIYSDVVSACYNDVSDLTQNNCNAGTTGFSATKGWDAATGFGSINYECFSKVINTF